MQNFFLRYDRIANAILGYSIAIAILALGATATLILFGGPAEALLQEIFP